MKIPIYDRGLSIIGEGAQAGIPAWTIKAMGCPVLCPWCDTAETWEASDSEKRGFPMEAEALAMEAASKPAEWVNLTGGEPALYNWRLFLDILRVECQGMKIQIETSGALLIPLHGMLAQRFDYISVSPKRNKAARPEMLAAADELKIVIDAPDDPWFMPAVGLRREGAPVYLIPEWKAQRDPDTLAFIRKMLREYPGTFRAGFQIHKLLKAD